MRDRIKVKGMVTVRVLDKDGNVKRKAPGWFRRLIGIPGRLMVFSHHNIVTRHGDMLIADALLEVPTRTKVTSSSGYISVGTGWTGNSPKSNTRCNTPTGPLKPLDPNCPSLKDSGLGGGTDSTTVSYRATFVAGDLNVNGINEAALLNNTEYADCLAYAQITPVTNVTASDTLQVEWDITILGQ